MNMSVKLNNQVSNWGRGLDEIVAPKTSSIQPTTRNDKIWRVGNWQIKLLNVSRERDSLQTVFNHILTAPEKTKPNGDISFSNLKNYGRCCYLLDTLL